MTTPIGKKTIKTLAEVVCTCMYVMILDWIIDCDSQPCILCVAVTWPDSLVKQRKMNKGYVSLLSLHTPTPQPTCLLFIPIYLVFTTLSSLLRASNFQMCI